MDAAGYGTGALMSGLAAIRAGKPVHPQGVVHRARLIVEGGAAAPPGSELLSRPATRPAIVRFSRSIGLPQPLPDLLGASIRILDAYGRDRHQDILLVTSFDLPVLHYGVMLTKDLQARPYSSSFPYRAGDRTFLLGLLPRAESPRPDGRDEFDRLDRAAATGRLAFDLSVAPHAGRFSRVASLHVEERLPGGADALRFNPFNTGGGLEPAGFLNAIRDYAYPMAQATWGRRKGLDRAQRKADEEMREVADRSSEPAASPQPPAVAGSVG